MDYLLQNLNNSKILPYDIMYEIYQYADPMYSIVKSIKNNNYMIHANNKSKDIYFYNFKRRPYIICGLDSRGILFNKVQMIWDLQITHSKNILEEFILKLSIEEIYQLWCKL